MTSTFKIVLVGDGGVGKTSFVNRHRSGEFTKKYLPTQGVDVSTLTFNTNYGVITFKVWDCAGQEKLGGLKDGYYLNADGAIVMFDMGNSQTCDNVVDWILNVWKPCPNIPLVICGNKRDLENGKVTMNGLPSKTGYFEISVKYSYNYERPFLYLAKRLTGHEDLEFVEISCSNTLPKVDNTTPVVSSNTFSFIDSNTLPKVGYSLPIVGNNSLPFIDSNTLPKVGNSLPVVDNSLPIVDSNNSLPKVGNNTLPFFGNTSPVVNETLNNNFIVPKKKVCLMTIPGGYMRITYEFFKDGEVIEQ